MFLMFLIVHQSQSQSSDNHQINKSNATQKMVKIVHHPQATRKKILVGQREEPLQQR